MSQVLADAFADYPWTTWTVDPSDHVARIAQLQLLAFTELVLPFGEGWVAVHDDRIVSAAMWMRPDSTVPEAVWHAMEPLQAQLEGDRHTASMQAEAFLAPYRPTAPHYFLGAVGTSPPFQGRGFGRAALAPVLNRLAREGTGAYLETCGIDNVSFYAALGFVVVAEVSVPSGGPTVWAMVNEARAS